MGAQLEYLNISDTTNHNYIMLICVCVRYFIIKILIGKKMEPIVLENVEDAN